MDGKRRTPVSPAVVAGEGRRILPANNRLLIAEFGTCTSRSAPNGKDSSRAWQDRTLGHPHENVELNRSDL